jgi:hypothetical protein
MRQTAYAETDLDHDDQPTDFSVRYAENRDEAFNNPSTSRSYDAMQQETCYVSQIPTHYDLRQFEH